MNDSFDFLEEDPGPITNLDAFEVPEDIEDYEDLGEFEFNDDLREQWLDNNNLTEDEYGEFIYPLSDSGEGEYLNEASPSPKEFERIYEYEDDHLLSSPEEKLPDVPETTAPLNLDSIDSKSIVGEFSEHDMGIYSLVRKP